MAHFTKPSESWTEHFGLATTPVSYEDSINPAHYELERDAIFRKTWLNVGRTEQLPRKGSYFTKELDAARTSVIVVRDGQDKVRAFHNICRHRGNKLVWNDFPGEEVAGTCRQFTCKYHGWRYGLEGDLKFVLHGKRLRGGWVLVRMNRPGRAEWLLIKHRDDTADAEYDVTAEETTSVTTDRTMEEIAEGNRVWHSNR